jgi:hypothetical protein
MMTTRRQPRLVSGFRFVTLLSRLMGELPKRIWIGVRHVKD